MSVEDTIKLIQKHCRENHKEIDERLTRGSTKFSNHEARIEGLELKHERLMHQLDTANSRLNYVFGGVVVACILLAINALLMTNGG